MEYRIEIIPCGNDAPPKVTDNLISACMRAVNHFATTLYDAFAHNDVLFQFKDG